MAHIKGKPKTGGRKKGTPNKLSGDVKAIITAFVERELQNIDSLIVEADAATRLNFLAKIMPYVLPKMQEIKSEDNSFTKYLMETSRYNDVEVTEEMRVKAEAIMMAKHATAINKQYTNA